MGFHHVAIATKDTKANHEFEHHFCRSVYTRDPNPSFDEDAVITIHRAGERS